MPGLRHFHIRLLYMLYYKQPLKLHHKETAETVRLMFVSSEVYYTNLAHWRNQLEINSFPRTLLHVNGFGPNNILLL
uniref:Uncharacterized protein n=1 Tax=Picea sitchensis TaxID=3332 RepID=A9NWI4_PICSI|nr:unknown [Picea sitchensis]